MVFKSRRVVRAWFLPISVPTMLGLLGVLWLFARGLPAPVGVMVQGLLVALAVIVVGWTIRSLFVGVWIEGDRVVVRSWLRTEAYSRQELGRFYCDHYDGMALWVMAVRAPLFTSYTMLRVSFLDERPWRGLRSTFAPEWITDRQVEQLNGWLHGSP